MLILLVFFNAPNFFFTAIGFGFHYWLVVIATRNEICTSQKTIIVESTDVAVVPALNDYQDLITVVVSQYDAVSFSSVHNAFLCPPLSKNNQ